MARHLVGHCNGESLWVKTVLVDGAYIETCSGCGVLIPEEVWSEEEDRPSHEICVAHG